MSGQSPVARPGDDPMGLAALADDHLAYLESAHFSPHTLRNRRCYLRQFCRWCKERGISRPVEVSRPVLERYRKWIYHYRQHNGRPLSWPSQCHKLLAVKMYLKWLVRANVLLYNPAAELEMPRPQRKLPTAIMTLEEVEQVLSTPDVSDPLGVRNRAILETLYSTGMRRMEIVGLTLYDLNIDRGTILIRRGKGRKDRVVPIGERALGWIDRYLIEVRPHIVVPPDDDYLFLNNRGVQFTDRGMTRTCHAIIKASGITKEGACHIFRHTCATLMMESGAGLRFIQQLLGHEHLSTTEVYTRVSIKKLKQVHTKTHPSAQRSRAASNEENKPSEKALEDLLAELVEEDDEAGEAGEFAEDEGRT